MRTAKEMAQEALDVQDACNLSGVVHSFSRAMTDLRKSVPEKGTDWYNHHPIAVMWADKIASLTGVQKIEAGDDTFGKAYRWCLDAYNSPNLNNFEYDLEIE